MSGLLWKSGLEGGAFRGLAIWISWPNIISVCIVISKIALWSCNFVCKVLCMLSSPIERLAIIDLMRKGESRARETCFPWRVGKLGSPGRGGKAGGRGQKRLTVSEGPGDKLPLQFYKLKSKATSATRRRTALGYQDICLIVSDIFVSDGKENLPFYLPFW